MTAPTATPDALSRVLRRADEAVDRLLDDHRLCTLAHLVKNRW